MSIVSELLREMTSMSGYQCLDCGQWVYPGVTHFCPQPPVRYEYVKSIDEQLLSVLERIAKALELLCEKR